jgi:hypothetical protein
MVKPEHIEGRQATENFEEGMKALFKVPKDSVARAEKEEATEDGFLPRPECTQATGFRQGLEVECALGHQHRFPPPRLSSWAASLRLRARVWLPGRG